MNILNIQIKQLKSSKVHNLQEVQIPYDLFEQTTLYSTYNSGIAWIDGLNGSVRPVLAYSFFLTYCLVKYMQYSALLNLAPQIVYIETIWNSDDQAIFASIISFYFGHRTFRKTMSNK